MGLQMAASSSGARVPLKDEDELEEIEGALGAASSGNGYHAVNAMNREPGTAAQLGKIYLIVYAVVMGADWLQGPYLYSLYHEQYEYVEHMVAVLFVTGFIAAGVTAPLVGAWADQYGRKRICMYFCILYMLSCVTKLFQNFGMLFLGRVLGGIATSILFSVFEAWLISSSNARHLTSAELSSIMGRASLVNGFVATLAGVVSNGLVSWSESFVSPFIASGAFLMIGWVLIRALWTENYGGQSGAPGSSGGFFQVARVKESLAIVFTDGALLSLGLTQTFFEGTMYFWVLIWVPSLQETSPGISLPLGYIFSSFMISMSLGSLVYGAIVTHSNPTDSPLVLHAKLSSLVCAVSCFSLAASFSSNRPETRFWAFCLFEGCVGMYYPIQGMLRGALIPNDHRATLSSIFRIPLNVFVIVTLMSGVSSGPREYVLGICITLLAVAAFINGVIVVRRCGELSQGSTAPVRPP
jgi:hypothetical protein